MAKTAFQDAVPEIAPGVGGAIIGIASLSVMLEPSATLIGTVGIAIVGVVFIVERWYAKGILSLQGVSVFVVLLYLVAIGYTLVWLAVKYGLPYPPILGWEQSALETSWNTLLFETIPALFGVVVSKLALNYRSSR